MAPRHGRKLHPKLSYGEYLPLMQEGTRIYNAAGGKEGGWRAVIAWMESDALIASIGYANINRLHKRMLATGYYAKGDRYIGYEPEGLNELEGTNG